MLRRPNLRNDAGGPGDSVASAGLLVILMTVGRGQDTLRRPRQLALVFRSRHSNLYLCPPHVSIFICLRKKLVEARKHLVHEDRNLTSNRSYSFGEKLFLIDWYGLVVFLVACVAVILALTWAGTKYAWNSPVVLKLLILGSFGLGVFLGNEWLMEPGRYFANLWPKMKPMIPVELLREI
ncbi:hypothetical protein RUND412_008893 [Rhizina undulata]